MDTDLSVQRKNKILSLIFSLLLCIDLVLAGYLLYSSSPTILFYLNPQARSSILLDQLSIFNSHLVNKEDYAAFRSRVNIAAKKTASIAITDCVLTPSIIKADASSMITFTNNGDKTTYITLAREKPLRIEPHKSVTSDLTFIKDIPTIANIGCTGAKKGVGILYVTSEQDNN